MSMYPDEQILTIGGEEVTYPGLDAGKFTDGDPADPLKKPSFIPSETINLILDNLSEMITKLGGVPDNVTTSQLADIFASAATPDTGVCRDAAGRFKAAAPAAADDVARKNEVDTHSGENITDANAVHGIQQGAGNGFDADKLDGQHLSDILNAVWPVGATYIQFPGDSSPSGLGLPGTWSNVSSELAGDFIRFEGGTEALGFEGGEQLDAFQGHKIRDWGSGSDYGSGTAGPQYAGNSLGLDTWMDNSGQIIVTDGVNGTPRVDIETRPVNRTVRKWRRTA